MWWAILVGSAKREQHVGEFAKGGRGLPRKSRHAIVLAPASCPGIRPPNPTLLVYAATSVLGSVRPAPSSASSDCGEIKRPIY